MNGRRNVPLAVLGALLAGCVSPTGSSNGPVAITVSVGQEFVVAPDGISFRLDSIRSDSRCPVDVVCVQDGPVILKFAVGLPTQQAPTTLELNSQHADSSTGILLNVTAIDPVRHAGTTIPQATYRIHLLVGHP